MCVWFLQANRSEKAGLSIHHLWTMKGLTVFSDFCDNKEPYHELKPEADAANFYLPHPFSEIVNPHQLYEAPNPTPTP